MGGADATVLQCVQNLPGRTMRASEAALEATDDVALLEAIGIEVAIVPASALNFKVTHPDDAARAEMLLGASL